MTTSVVMTVREGRNGIDIAEADHAGENYTATSRNGATMKLARVLVEAGATDEPIEAWGSDGRLRFTSPSLHALARATIEEGERGIRLRRWRGADMGGEAAQDGVDGDRRPERPDHLKVA